MASTVNRTNFNIGLVLNEETLPQDAGTRCLHYCDYLDLVALSKVSYTYLRTILEAAPDVARNHTQYHPIHSSQIDLLGINELFKGLNRIASSMGLTPPGTPHFHSLREFMLCDRTLSNPGDDVLRNTFFEKHIMEMIDSLKTLNHLKTLDLRSAFASTRSLEDLSKKLPALTDLKVYNCSSLQFLPFSPAVQSLSVHGFSQMCEGTLIPAFAIGRNIHIRGNADHNLLHPITTFPHFATLTELRLTNINNLTDEIAANIGSQLKNLNKLSIDECIPLTAEGLCAFTENSLSSLTEFELRGDLNLEQITPDSLTSLGALMNLKRLKLHNSDSVTNESIIQLLTSSRHSFQYIDLAILDKVTDELFYEMPTLFPNISSCLLSNCAAITLLGMTHFFTHARLKEVTLSFLPANDEIVTTLVENQPNLTSLVFNLVTGVFTDHTLKLLAQSRNLTNLDLTASVTNGEFIFTEEAIQNIARVWMQKASPDANLLLFSNNIDQFDKNYADFRAGKPVHFLDSKEKQKMWGLTFFWDAFFK